MPQLRPEHRGDAIRAPQPLIGCSSLRPHASACFLTAFPGRAEDPSVEFGVDTAVLRDGPSSANVLLQSAAWRLTCLEGRIT